MFEAGRIVGTLVRASSRAASGAGLAVVFVTTTVAGVALHANLAGARRLAGALGHEALVATFAGELHFEGVQEIRLGRITRVRVAEARVTAEGRTVIVARGVEATLALGALLRSLASGRAIDVTVDDARIDDARVDLSTTPAGELLVARAFAPRAPAPSALPEITVPVAPRPLPRVRIRGVKLRHGWVHGDLLSPPLDGDVSDVRGDVVYEDGAVRIDDVTGRVLLRSPHVADAGTIEGALRGGLVIGARPGERAGQASFEGRVGALPVNAEASYRDGHVEAHLVAKEAPAEAWTRTLPFLPLHGPASFEATAKGAWPSVEVDAQLTAGRGRAHVVGSVDLFEPVTFRGEATAEDVDLAVFGGPETRLSATGRAQGSHTASGLLGTFRVDDAAGEIEGNPLPKTSVEGRFEGGLVAGTLRAREPGLDASGKIVVDAASHAVLFDMQARATDLAALTRLHRVPHVAGSASLRASGSVDTTTGRVRGALSASGENLSSSGASAAHVAGTAAFAGPLLAPTFDASLTARRLRYTEPGKKPLEYAETSARARVELVPTPRLTNVLVEVAVEPGAPKVVAHAASIGTSNGNVAIEGARLEGLGSPIAFDVRRTGAGFAVRARGEDVAIESVARASGLAVLTALPPKSRASFDVDLRSDGRTLDGHARARVVSEGFAEVSVDAAARDGRILGSGRLDVATVGHVEATRFDVALGGPSGPFAVDEATGSADLEGEVDLGTFAGQLLGELVNGVEGKVALSGHVERPSRQEAPRVRVTATSRGLDVRAERSAHRELRIAGVDASVHLAWDGASDDAEASVVAWDARGPLLTASAKTRIPLLAWVTGAAKPTADVLAALPVDARVDVRRRELAQLPAWMSPPGADGHVGLVAEAHGVMASPSVAVKATATNLRRRGPATSDEERFLPVDAALDARWDGQDVVVTITADERARRRIAGGSARKLGSARGLLIGKLSASDLLHDRAGDTPLRGSAELDVDDIDLAPLPLPYDARGRVSGRFRVKDMPEQPSFEATAKMTEVALAGADVGSGDLVVAGHDGFLYSLVRLSPPDGGSVTAQLVSNALRLGPGGVVWDDTLTTRVDYALDAGRLSLLRPVASGFATEIDGLVDGRGSVTFSATEQAFDGGASIRNARVYVNAIGEEITELSGVARFERSGSFRVDEIRGKVGLGALRAAASGRLRGLGVAHVEATMVVPPPRGVPLSSEAATFGEATGEMKMVLDVPEGDGPVQVEITVPRGEVTIPDRTTQALQSLDPDRSIALGIRTPDGELLRISRRGRLVSKKAIVTTDRLRGGRLGDLSRAGRAREVQKESVDARFDVLVGPDVLVEGRGMRIKLGGRTVVELADDIDVTGQISLAEGSIDVQGRKFTLESGTITFPEGGDLDNPTVVASAYWDAPDGTRVWAEYAAPLETGTLTLRSEPPYSKNEILSLLLFGRPEGNLAAKGSGSALGTGVAGGLVATGLNRALDEVSGGEIEIEANVGSTRFNQSRPEIGVRRKNLGVSVGYVVGPPSYVQPDRTLVTVDWQFIPRWSLVATRGDRSTSIVDVLYRFRY